MRLVDQEAHFQYCRMSVAKFDSLLQRVQPLIEKQFTNFREPISARDRLYVTLRYLASGDAMSSMAYAYRIGRSTVSQIVSETCDALWEVLQDELLEPSDENWKRIAAEFNDCWQFPHCIGAIDGKHVAIKCPSNAGSMYYNYKGFHSIVLMAIASASYRFMLVDIGAQGRHSDGGVFLNSVMGQKFHQEQLNIPLPSPLHINGPSLPYMIVADEAFQLNKFTLRPYPGRRPITASLETAEKIVKAAVVLHNFLLPEPAYCPPLFGDSVARNGDIVEGQWRQMDLDNTAFHRVGRAGGQAHSRYAAERRNEFKDYFLNEGTVPWQWDLRHALQ
ncbi:PREDICTED: putative nuclease HARBI1 [Vollenhovia emeryi]|uniref:putative nuclease HARBI1 n=1 Tax=Vollenhovia emeryi TaxID=411798 RepID=UPI0005F412F9|nr:PREDICTED: putative nuclease HARBI1 [Vollenhovia emeryi]